MHQLTTITAFRNRSLKSIKNDQVLFNATVEVAVKIQKRDTAQQEKKNSSALLKTLKQLLIRYSFDIFIIFMHLPMYYIFYIVAVVVVVVIVAGIQKTAKLQS